MVTEGERIREKSLLRREDNKRVGLKNKTADDWQFINIFEDQSFLESKKPEEIYTNDVQNVPQARSSMLIALNLLLYLSISTAANLLLRLNS